MAGLNYGCLVGAATILAIVAFFGAYGSLRVHGGGENWQDREEREWQERKRAEEREAREEARRREDAVWREHDERTRRRK